MEGTKITLGQWNSLPVETRRRAIGFIMGYQARDWMAEEKLESDDIMWKLVSPAVRILPETSAYKLIINGRTFIN